MGIIIMMVSHLHRNDNHSSKNRRVLSTPWNVKTERIRLSYAMQNVGYISRIFGKITWNPQYIDAKECINVNEMYQVGRQVGDVRVQRISSGQLCNMIKSHFSNDNHVYYYVPLYQIPSVPNQSSHILWRYPTFLMRKYPSALKRINIEISDLFTIQ